MEGIMEGLAMGTFTVGGPLLGGEGVPYDWDTTASFYFELVAGSFRFLGVEW